MTYTATYSPEDNKLRLYASSRLDKETYERVKAAGFKWAPKQELFVAPMWTPSREDLLLELAGEIGDEDKTLVERQEERAERFEEYSDNRMADSEAARKAVHAISDNIPFGQPILVGHHSEKRARKDAERIENGMRRAVKMWDQAQYWKDRAAGALRLAKYKERPDVRARRIKGLEADLRREEKSQKKAKFCLTFWRGDAKDKMGQKIIVDYPTALHFCNYYDNASYYFTLAKYPRTAPKSQYEGMMSLWSALGGIRGEDEAIITVEQAKQLSLVTHERAIASIQRWIDHLIHRLDYEHAMLEEQGGLITDRCEIEVGGKVLYKGEWVTVLRINRKDGAIVSLSTSRKYVPVVGIEGVIDYKAPTPEEAAKIEKAMTKGPRCNYLGPRFATMTQAEWDGMNKDYRGYRNVEPTATAARHRVPICIGFKCHLPPKEGKELEPNYCDANRTRTYWPVFITDAKRKDPPAPDGEQPLKCINEPVYREPRTSDSSPSNEGAKAEDFDSMRKTLKEGVKVVSVPQLFPTPPDLVKRMIEKAVGTYGVLAGRTVLEPSAGTGNIVRAIFDNATGPDCVRVTAVEINATLVEGLETDRLRRCYANEKNFRIVHADFLGCNPDHVGLETLGYFDVILMNPPFENGADIKHIKHALTFLKPKGVLVAICANGPRQGDQLGPLAESWEALPSDTFKGTGVHAAMLVIRPQQQAAWSGETRSGETARLPFGD